MEKKQSINISNWAQAIIGGIGTFFLILIISGVIYCFLHPSEGPTGCAIGLGFILMLLPGPFILLCGMGVIKLKSYWRIFIYIAIILVSMPLVLLFSGLIGWVMSGFKRY